MKSSDLKRPYLDFYQGQQIAPVHQDVTDLARHYSRRESLYRLLGIPASLVEGTSVLEFGPGPGFNALYTASLKPSRYVLVDGNPVSIKLLHENFQKYSVKLPSLEIASSLIEEFDTKELFDIVICEGVIPFQLDPKGFVQRVSKFVKPGGILVVTCIDPVSFLGESIRRLLAMKISPFNDKPEKRIKDLELFFLPHLKSLKAMSRPVRDWLEDNILIKYYGAFFSVADAIDALQNNFEIYGSSPKFNMDLRWYKELYLDQRKFNSLAKSQYFQNIGNLIDYRLIVPPQEEQKGIELLQHAQKLFNSMLEMEELGLTSDRINNAANQIEVIAKVAQSFSDPTAIALREAANFFQNPNPSPNVELKNFQEFFGRGQQYLSFIKQR